MLQLSFVVFIMNKNLNQILPDSEGDDVLETPLIKIRGKTMFFGNVIY